jgi:FtsZ-interacting cell division protein ZipA
MPLALLSNELFLGALVIILVVGIVVHKVWGLKRAYRYFFGGSKKRAQEAKTDTSTVTAEATVDATPKAATSDAK